MAWWVREGGQRAERGGVCKEGRAGHGQEQPPDSTGQAGTPLPLPCRTSSSVTAIWAMRAMSRTSGGAICRPPPLPPSGALLAAARQGACSRCTWAAAAAERARGRPALRLWASMWRGEGRQRGGCWPARGAIDCVALWITAWVQARAKMALDPQSRGTASSIWTRSSRQASLGGPATTPLALRSDEGGRGPGGRRAPALAALRLPLRPAAPERQSRVLGVRPMPATGMQGRLRRPANQTPRRRRSHTRLRPPLPGRFAGPWDFTAPTVVTAETENAFRLLTLKTPPPQTQPLHPRQPAAAPPPQPQQQGLPARCACRRISWHESSAAAALAVVATMPQPPLLPSYL